MWVRGALALAVLLGGCYSAVKKTENQKPDEIDSNPDTTTTPQTHLTEYVAPKQVWTAPQTNGMTSHPLDKGNWYQRLKCNNDAPQADCEFVSANKLYAFDGANPTAEIAPQAIVNFKPTIDGKNQAISDFLTTDTMHYALYADRPQNKTVIGMWDKSGVYKGGFTFPEIDGKPTVTPNSLVQIGSEIYVSIANWTGDTNFQPGKIVQLHQNTDGTLQYVKAVTTTQFSPQALTIWNNEGKNYLLGVNTGRTSHSGDILSESGVDMIDPDTLQIVANIPLGFAAANSLSLTPDGKVAILGSQARPQGYALDMEMLKTKLAKLASQRAEMGVITFTADVLPEVARINTNNAFPTTYTGYAFIPSLQYDAKSKSIFASSYEEGSIRQFGADYEVIPNVGVQFGENFGKAVNSYVCAGGNDRFCADVAFTQGGMLAFTGSPSTLTGYANSQVTGR